MTSFKTPQLRAALAAANLINGGLAKEAALLDTVQKWSDMLSHATDHFREYLRAIASLPLSTSVSERTDGKRLYLSWHQFPYQLIYKVLGTHRPGERINILSGKFPEPFATRYTDALAAELDCKVRIIQSSPKVVREVQSALRRESVVTYIDSHWSASREPTFDRSYPVAFGEFRSRSTFERLIEHLGDSYEFVRVSGDPARSAQLTGMGSLSFAQMYACTATQILADPASFQNLDKLHQSVAFDQPKNWTISFIEGGRRYAIRTDTMKLYRADQLDGRLPPERAIARPGSDVARLFDCYLHQESDGVLLL